MISITKYFQLTGLFSPKVNQNHKSLSFIICTCYQVEICKLVLPIFIFLCQSFTSAFIDIYCLIFYFFSVYDIFGYSIRIFHPDSREERWWPIIWLSIVLGHKFYKSFKLQLNSSEKQVRDSDSKVINYLVFTLKVQLILVSCIFSEIVVARGDFVCSVWSPESNWLFDINMISLLIFRACLS